MSRVTEFPDEEGRALRKDPDRGGDEGNGGGQSSLRMPKLSLGGRISEFYQGIKLEMRKTTWPTRNEVWSTTVVVLIAVVFFGFYLFGVDWLVTQGFNYLEQVFGPK